MGELTATRSTGGLVLRVACAERRSKPLARAFVVQPDHDLLFVERHVVMLDED